MEAPGEGQTESPGRVVAPAARMPPGSHPSSTWDRRSRAYSAVPPLVHWRMRFSATMRPAMTYGRTCGLNAAKAAVSYHGQYFR